MSWRSLTGIHITCIGVDEMIDYKRLVDAITDHDRRRTARIMTAYVGEAHRISKQDLCREVFGEHNTSTDRQIREIIAFLTTDGFPICTSSSPTKGGYWLAATRDEAILAAKDIESRIEDLAKRAKALRQADLPAVLPEQRAAALQGSLL